MNHTYPVSRLLAMAILVSGTLTASSIGAAASAASVAEVFASPKGVGSSCSKTTPCSLSTAVASVAPGGAVRLLGGSYASTRLAGTSKVSATSAPVTVSPASSTAKPVIAGVDQALPNLRWSDVRVTGAFRIRRETVGVQLVRMSFTGGGHLLLSGSRVVVRDSVFKDGYDVDGVQMGGAKDVLFENNVIRRFYRSIGSPAHTDCLQIFDSSNIVVRGNRISDCFNAGIILSAASNPGIANLTVESNFVQGCVKKTAVCASGSSGDFRERSATNLVVRNNTFLDAPLRLPVGSSRTAFDRNIIGDMPACDSPITNSVVISWNQRWCASPAILKVNGNRVGSPTFVDTADQDFALRVLSSARVAPATSRKAAAQAIDGRTMPADIAGAALDSAEPMRPLAAAGMS